MGQSIQESISQLVTLQAIDRQRKEKTEDISVREQEIADFESRLQAQRDMAQALEEERANVEKQRYEMEAHLESENAKITDRRMRMNRVRNEKEHLALQYEIDTSKETNQQAEEDLLQVMESQEQLVAESQEATGALTELEKTLHTEITDRHSTIGALRGALQVGETERAQLTNSIEPRLLKKYEQIFARRSGNAVVEVRGGTCTGCNIQLPPQFYNELQRVEDIRECPSCHRILFWRPDALESAEELC